ncbi:hypothetical protein P9314_13680 [Paenibacillus validus]|uniref:hypothetical protein n=1 Tax=Paenibacillus validus TaxID=44253 RepID=UPI000FD6DA42|nr:hypothetical protein [Paenibacillus validus]MED4601752.1 hypothetical protein [Paenibacillus validus]MED4605479.1 hypothetical protein [Paenibacillus validus]
MLILLQLAGGVLLAVLLWTVLKWTLQALLWGLGTVLAITLIFPGVLIMIGSLLFAAIGLLAALGLLLLASAFRS